MIVNEEQRRAMEFIAEVNLGGYRPTGREINQWRLQPEPKPMRKGKLLQPEVPAEPDRRVRKRRKNATGISALMDSVLKSQNLGATLSTQYTSAIARAVAGLNPPGVDLSRFANAAQLAGLGLFDEWEYEVIPGKPGKAAVYAPDKPPEKFLAHLRRLGWIERDRRRRYGLTLLGRALLAAEAVAESDAENSSVVVLAAEDQKLGYGQVLGRIATCGDAIIVDHYLGTQELMDLLEHTDASRFLIGPKLAKDRVTELSVQVKLAVPNAMGVVRELRRADFHDRYLVGEQNVYTLTASLNGVSKSSMALLMQMTDVAADAIRAHVDKLWENAEPVAIGLSQEDLDAEPEDDDGTQKVIVEEDGRFLHDGCEVRHRKRQAAENCTNGA